MIKNFEELKKQLSELSPVINSFKSESVQLKIVELIFQGAEFPTEEFDESGSKPRSQVKYKSRAKKTKSVDSKQSTSSMTKKTTKKGPAVILSDLINEGYFDEPRTIKQIISHSDTNKATKLKATALSGPLARFVRDKKLKRKKNSEGQYEYTKI